MSMKLRIAALAAVVGTMPMFAQASNAPVALNSCVKAFMTSLSSKYATAPKLRDAYYVDNGAVFSQAHQLELTATNPRDNSRVARAVCTVDAQGQVVDLRDASYLP